MENKQDLRWLGVWIKLERLKRNWSQEGLCHGLCAVSYLSKIEQGKVPAPNPDLMRLLCKRLDGAWEDDPAVLAPLESRVEEMYDAFLDADFGRFWALHKGLMEHWEEYLHSPFLLDALILGYESEEDKVRLSEAELTLLKEMEPVLSHRQRTVCKISAGRATELLDKDPSSREYLGAGIEYYQSGAYTRSVELLQTAFQMGAAEGRVCIMLLARVFSGNCYANLQDYPQMTAHYRVAEKIARAVGDLEEVETIRYNIAATALDLGRAEEAYAYFHAACGEEKPAETLSVMALHKLARCCEALGKTEEALSALDRAERAKAVYPEREFALEICGLVRYRLTHEDYIHDPVYGEKLTRCFERMERELPPGFAGSHIPYMLAWYTENRMYKDAYQLLFRFPGYKSPPVHPPASL